MSIIEQQLQRTLRPVDPNPAFVNRLQTHLVNPGPSLAAAPARSYVPFAVLLGLGVGLVIMWILRQFR